MICIEHSVAILVCSVLWICDSLPKCIQIVDHPLKLVDPLETRTRCTLFHNSPLFISHLSPDQPGSQIQLRRMSLILLQVPWGPHGSRVQMSTIWSHLSEKNHCDRPTMIASGSILHNLSTSRQLHVPSYQLFTKIYKMYSTFSYICIFTYM